MLIKCSHFGTTRDIRVTEYSLHANHGPRCGQERSRTW